MKGSVISENSVVNIIKKTKMVKMLKIASIKLHSFLCISVLKTTKYSINNTGQAVNFPTKLQQLNPKV